MKLSIFTLTALAAALFGGVLAASAFAESAAQPSAAASIAAPTVPAAPAAPANAAALDKSSPKLFGLAVSDPGAPSNPKKKKK